MKKVLSIILALLLITTTLAFSFSVAFADEGTVGQIKTVYEPTTGIILAPTVVQKIDSQNDFDGLYSATKKTQVAYFTLDATGENVVLDGTNTKTLESAFKKCDSSIIPMFNVPNTDAAVTLVTFVTNNSASDLIAVSNDTNVLDYIHSQQSAAGSYPIRLAYNVQALDDIYKVHYTTTAHNSTLAVVNTDLTREQMEYLQARFVSVWYFPDSVLTAVDNDSAVDTAVTREALDNGANGILVTDQNTPYSLYESVTRENVRCRRVSINAHRGLWTTSNTYHENSLEAIKESFDWGIDCSEIDIFYTKEGDFVVSHDQWVNGYDVVNNTREDVKANLDLGTNENTGETIRIAYFDEVLELLKQEKYSDKMIMLEFKGTSYDFEKLASMIEESGTKDRFVIISFTRSLISEFQKYIDIPCADLNNIGSLSSALTNLALCNSIPATSTIISSYGKQFARRGIATVVWTIDSTSNMQACVNYGAIGLTSNYPILFKKLYTDEMDKEQLNVEYILGETEASETTTTTPATVDDNVWLYVGSVDKKTVAKTYTKTDYPNAADALQAAFNDYANCEFELNCHINNSNQIIINQDMTLNKQVKMKRSVTGFYNAEHTITSTYDGVSVDCQDYSLYLCGPTNGFSTQDELYVPYENNAFFGNVSLQVGGYIAGSLKIQNLKLLSKLGNFSVANVGADFVLTGNVSNAISSTSSFTIYGNYDYSAIEGAANISNAAAFTGIVNGNIITPTGTIVGGGTAATTTLPSLGDNVWCYIGTADGKTATVKFTKEEYPNAANALQAAFDYVKNNDEGCKDAINGVHVCINQNMTLDKQVTVSCWMWLDNRQYTITSIYDGSAILGSGSGLYLYGSTTAPGSSYVSSEGNAFFENFSLQGGGYINSDLSIKNCKQIQKLGSYGSWVVAEDLVLTGTVSGLGSSGNITVKGNYDYSGVNSSYVITAEGFKGTVEGEWIGPDTDIETTVTTTTVKDDNVEEETTATSATTTTTTTTTTIKPSTSTDGTYKYTTIIDASDYASTMLSKGTYKSPWYIDGLTTSYDFQQTGYDATANDGNGALIMKRGWYDHQGLYYFDSSLGSIAADSIGFRVWIQAGENASTSENVLYFVFDTVDEAGTHTAYSVGWYNSPQYGTTITEEGGWIEFKWSDLKFRSNSSASLTKDRPSLSVGANAIVSADEWLPSLDGFVIGLSGPTDKSAYYNIGDFQLISENTTLTTDAISTMQGATIRLNKVNGIRFHTTVDIEKLTSLVGENDYELGTLIAPKDTAGDYLTVEDDHVKVAYNMTNDLWAGNQIVGSLVNIKDKNIARDFVARAYVLVDGVYYYSETQSVRSLAYVADAFMNDTERFETVDADTKALVEAWASKLNG